MTTGIAETTLTPPQPHDWRRAYALRLAVSDAVSLIWVVFGVQIAYFGIDSTALKFSENALNLALSYTAVSVGIVAGWLLLLHVFGTRAVRVVGTGSEEYKLVANSSFALFGFVAIAAYLFKADIARGYVLLAFPLGMVLLVFTRWMWRQWLGAKRRTGDYSSRVVLVGSEESVQRICLDLNRQSSAGYHVVGACIPRGVAGATVGLSPITVLGPLTAVPQALEGAGADTVVVTSSDEFTSQGMRELSWSLEPGRFHLVVVPRLIDIGGPRIHTRPVSGLPLIHVETPRYEGPKLFVKRLFDVVVSALLLIVLSPLLSAVAVAVAASSKGPILYLQERVGLNGGPFQMYKFRSMRVGADGELAALLAKQGTSDKPLFKVSNDPRLTRIGGFLRRYSIDELLQLVNVLRGDMSLVGPRPQRDGEVALYDSAAHRRLYVKPGMSGLWQVSGRSNLTWEESIRLDLYYVENWSISGDIVILFRTAKAVVSRDGAF